ncbi:DUF5674 family protein [Merismopedia glauca]|uniref:Uncharacterized protein n=1 Tax=Merismopedia glauca CCAP 1448/3 TaxID=1296344 RepID=A0A2T1C0A7_9CYAN|nr:DUF5674 family protein [Merismopedia glauca]PSB01691.1 hypothetical protein C7B64_17035 [Merismopedia glauca CCAP 1448/3]
MILIIRERATPEQISQMAETYFGLMIKLAVDIEREIVVGGAELYADCEQMLLEDGSQQVYVWGADWYLELKQVGFESLINIRPRQENRGMSIEDPVIRERIEIIVRHLLDG